MTQSTFPAAAYGHVHMIVLLNQFDPDLTQLVDQLGQTPLHVASQQDNADVVSLLIKIGADPRASDREGMTPLALSAHSTQVRKRIFSPVCILKVIISPRQARDKHRESTQKERRDAFSRRTLSACSTSRSCRPRP